MPCKEVLLIDFSNVNSGESWKRFSQTIIPFGPVYVVYFYFSDLAYSTQLVLELKFWD